MASRITTAAKPQPLGATGEVAEHLGIPERTLIQWRYLGVGPRYLKIGRHVRYRWSDVDEWLATREVSADAI
jgi:excisionase family DNA binding protein